MLIDEIGSGTDPAEGSALAIAILQKLNNENIISIATTHQSALKEFAHKTDFVKNAAMQFDDDNDVAEKCDLCIDRLEQGKAPACSAVCATQCIFWGDTKQLSERLADRGRP